MPGTLRFERVAVVGATGPTGRALVRELAARDIPVRAVSRTLESLAAAFPEPEIDRGAGDALDFESLARAVEGCDLLVDCIGLPAGRMADHPKTARNLAGLMRRTGARGLQVSSFWCYMPLRDMPLTEAHPRIGGPPWARIRREAEDVLRAAGAAVVHLPDFFGPQVHTSTLQMAIRDAAAGKPMNWIGDADTRREYVYVPDAMRAVAELLTYEAAYGDDWIVPGSGPISGRELAALLSDILGREVKLRAAGPLLLRIASLFNADLRAFLPMVPEYMKPVTYDGSKLERLIGPVTRTGYRESIEMVLRNSSTLCTNFESTNLGF